MPEKVENSNWLNELENTLSLAGSVGTLITAAILIYGIVTSVFLWRARSHRHRFSKVYFPKSRSDFYEYYVRQVSKAKWAIYITSDGFNMKNSASRKAAKLLNGAQTQAINRGASVFRYQMTTTMHLNWLDEICRMKEKHGDSYRTFINPHFEAVGHFAVIDPGKRKVVTEFMLPDVGGIGQATTPRDFGFIHGHQNKADETKAIFDRIFEHPDTVEVTADNLESFRRSLFDQRIEKHRIDDTYHVFDEEIMLGIKKYGQGVNYEQCRVLFADHNTNID